MAFYVNTLNTYYALCITSWENKRGNFYSVMLCFQGDRKCHEKKKKCRSHGVSKFPTMWHTEFKIFLK